MSTETENDSARLLRQADASEVVAWEHTNRTLRHIPSAATVPEDFVIPGYWAKLGYAGHIAQNDIIRCIPADSSYFVELMAREIGPEGIVMLVLRSGFFEGTVAAPGASKHEVDAEASFYYAGPLLKWQVLGPGGRVWKSGLNTQDEAASWLKAHREMQKRTTKGRP
jgi:hypothetical protein